MMVDLGAAPNPYEAETWGNRGRTVRLGATTTRRSGSTAPARRARSTVVNLAGSGAGGDAGRDVGRRADCRHDRPHGRTRPRRFRFLHSYLYEPRPGTGRYWFSDNVWHDANAELPWASDLTKLYDQESSSTASGR